MLFNSLSFVIFFPIVVVGYYLLPQRFRWMWLLAASCYFYMAFIPYYILVLAYLIIIDFCAGIAIEKAEGRKRKLFLTISIIANVGTLFIFKYFNFFNANVAQIASLIHWNYPIGVLSLALPLGLSFHTFQSLAYVMEVYYKRYPAEKHLGIYALYVMFFPQLVAGPIERPQQLLPQLHAPHDFDWQRTLGGIRLMLWGFFKKVAVADTIGILVDGVYANLHGMNGPTLTIAAFAFCVQLYGDFSGYTDIARGASEVFGITLVKNFDAPFFATSVAEFWRRWHMSLSSWFRDYFYYPLALFLTGKSPIGLYAATFITFAVIGLWHGAAWTYIFFGMTFGLYSDVGLLTKKIRARIANAIGIVRLPRLHAILQGITTFCLVTVGEIFFRSTSLHDAFYFIGHLFLGWSSAIDTSAFGLTAIQCAAAGTAAFVMLFGEYAERSSMVISKIMAKPAYIRWGFYYACALFCLVLALSIGAYHPRPFIYFQF
jgi:D-alanyl-lipoteichoic acid acyltransferase DltB (MBOAT superfamily)